jgi:hypothetical protein
MKSCFSEHYAEARDKFLAASRDAGAELRHFALGQQGPDGSELCTDAAWLGPRDARAVIVTISGTHGVEGFFGSAVQVEWLWRVGAAPLPTDVAALHVHALNPYGFAWLRRTNEDNVDINRNWMDFGSPLPASPLYDELSDDLCPSDWSPQSQALTGAHMAEWIGRHGAQAYQQAVSGGQWTHPDGLFYGGTAPTWSRRTLEAIVAANLGRAARVAILDFHTGLGPYGYAEPIIGWRRSDPGFARTRAWIGAAGKSLYGDGSISAEIQGDGLSALPKLLPHASVDVLAMECGIRPITEVANALRADAWLHRHADINGAEGKKIKKMVRAAFHSDDPTWQGMALGQGLAACTAALAGIGAAGE